MKGPKLSGNISGTDPLKDNRLLLKAEALDNTEEARHTAEVVNELSKEISRILVSHPLNAKRASEGKNIANVVLLRGCGIRIEVCCLILYLALAVFIILLYLIDGYMPQFAIIGGLLDKSLHAEMVLLLELLHLIYSTELLLFLYSVQHSKFW